MREAHSSAKKHNVGSLSTTWEEIKTSEDISSYAKAVKNAKNALAIAHSVLGALLPILCQRRRQKLL